MDRENRYLVFKRSDIEKYLPKEVKLQLSLITAGIEHNRGVDKRPPLDCVVVEHDWPMYDRTWTSIQGWVAKLDLEGRVKEALSNAEKNGYEFSDKTPSEIALDLMKYDSDLEDNEYCSVAAAVHAQITD